MAILASQKILTLDYWKTAHDLKKGDIIFDENGKPCTVTLVQEYRSPKCYAVQFNDSLEVCGDEHLTFFVETPYYREHLFRYKGVKKFTQKLQAVNIDGLLESEVPLSIPTTQPIKLPHQTLPVPPFLFGFWFFNRRADKTMAAPTGLTEYVHAQFKDCGYKVKEHSLLPKGEKKFSVTPTIESHLVGYPTHKIPNNYLMASEEQRIELLRGIMYAKSYQYSVKTNKFRFTSKHYNIILQMQGLLESLGHKIRVQHDTTLNNYSIFFKSKLPLLPNQRQPKSRVHLARRYIRKIKQLPEQLCVHIETDSPQNSFLVGEGFIPCH